MGKKWMCFGRINEMAKKGNSTVDMFKRSLIQAMIHGSLRQREHILVGNRVAVESNQNTSSENLKNILIYHLKTTKKSR